MSRAIIDPTDSADPLDLDYAAMRPRLMEIDHPGLSWPVDAALVGG